MVCCDFPGINHILNRQKIILILPPSPHYSSIFYRKKKASVDFVLSVSKQNWRQCVWYYMFTRMDSLDARGRSWSKIHVVGYALSVAQTNRQQEESKFPEDALCICPHLGALTGGPGPSLVLPALPLPVPTAAECFALLRGCCVTFCFQAWLKQHSGRYMVRTNRHSRLPLGADSLKLSNNFPQL